MELEMTHVLTSDEAREFVTRLGPSLGCGDYTYGPVFPEGRSDVCVVRHMAENGNDYGFDTLSLVWKDEAGTIRYRAFANTRDTKDYLNISEVSAEGDVVTVKYGSGGSFSGKAWETTQTLKLE
jgi:hypothetical protein